jgi:hypothetical protein
MPYQLMMRVHRPQPESAMVQVHAQEGDEDPQDVLRRMEEHCNETLGGGGGG